VKDYIKLSLMRAQMKEPFFFCLLRFGGFFPSIGWLSCTFFILYFLFSSNHSDVCLYMPLLVECVCVCVCVCVFVCSMGGSISFLATFWRPDTFGNAWYTSSLSYTSSLRPHTLLAQGLVHH
jgi:ABC-type polysaccharide/polyol phosphate export permease